MYVGVHEAKTTLSRLLVRVEAGEEIIIARGGRPVARLVPVSSEPTHRQPGRLSGRVRLRDDFDDPLPAEELARWTEMAE